jgi:hypothetical protein
MPRYTYDHKRYGDLYEMYDDEPDVYDHHMSLSEIAHNDRMDFANEVAAAGDPDRAAEIRMGA